MYYDFCRKIFVGGLSRDTGDGMIYSFFSHVCFRAVSYSFLAVSDTFVRIITLTVHFVIAWLSKFISLYHFNTTVDFPGHFYNSAMLQHAL